MDSNDKEYLLTTELDDTVWSKEPVPNSWECLCIYLIPRPATPSPQPDQLETPPEPGNMDISENIDIDI